MILQKDSDPAVNETEESPMKVIHVVEVSIAETAWTLGASAAAGLLLPP
jgi:hypothetical protein